MFGFVTRAELDAAEVRWKKRFEEIDHEWASWYDKYRRLYARLMKRAADAGNDETADAAGTGAARAAGPASPKDWNEYILSRRNHGVPRRSP